MDNGENDQRLRDRFLEFGATVTPHDLMPALYPEATLLVNENPFAFLLATSLDRGVPTETIWTIPFWLQQDLGHLDPFRLVSMGVDDIDVAVKRLPKKPRFVHAAPRTIFELSRMVANKFDGNAELIWKDKTAFEVQKTMRSIYGVGIGLAALTALLLVRCRNVQFSDWDQINVKPDIHVQRVLFRAGAADRMSETAALHVAARLNPDYPGAIDSALWRIGRTWCDEKRPLCSKCVLGDLCMKVGLTADGVDFNSKPRFDAFCKSSSKRNRPESQGE